MSPVKFVPLFLFLLSVSAFSGVEFHDAEIPISDEIKKAFLEDLGSLTVEEETGFNVLKYYKKGAKFPYLTIAHFHGIKMRHEYDLDSDGFAEVVKRKVDGERYVYEELGNFNKKENGHHYRRRYYPLYGTTKAKRVAEYRASLKEQFKIIGSKIVDIRAFSSPKRNKCLRMEMVPMGDSDLLLDVEDVVKRFSIDWTSSLRRAGRLMFPAKIEKSCDSKLENYLGTGEKFATFYGETVNEGLKCIKDLARGTEPNSGANLILKNGLTSLVGQHAYVVPRRPEDMDPSRVGFPRLAENNGPNPISIICSDNNFKFQGNGTEGLGYASNGKSVQETKMNCNGEELRVTHPFMSLNFDALNRSKGGSREQNRKILQKLIFHEYLHTAGWDHNDFWDPVEKCAAHCFGLGTRNDKDYCQGSGGAALITREGLERSTLLNYDIQRSNGQPADLALRSVREDFYSALLPPGMLPKEMQFQSMD